MIRVGAIDAHAGGAGLRLAVDGFPAPAGRTMREKRVWADAHLDDLRRALVLEPRGHADMVGAILTEPVSPGSHAGLLFMDRTRYVGLSSHGLIAAATIALERGLLVTGGHEAAILFDTEPGTVRVRIERAARLERVLCRYVPSFVLAAGIPMAIAGRQVSADIVFAGVFYAIVDSERAGLSLTGPHLPDIRRTGVAVMEALESRHRFVHPTDARVRGVEGVVFTSVAGEGSGGLRNVTVFADGQIDPSPSETGAAALTALLAAMGLLTTGTPLVHEGLSGATLRAAIADRTMVGDREAIVPEIEGVAWITGDHRFVAEDADPLSGGFRL
jgi:trans-L-3-hydroxyproline dehydratase